MKTIQVEISNKIYDKVLQVLQQFNSNDVKVIEVNEVDRNYLVKELESIDNGTAEFATIEELDKAMEERISKYENKNP